MFGNKQNSAEFYEKFLIKLLLFAAVFLPFIFSASGQNKTEPAAETTADYKKIIDEAFKKLEIVSYREKYQTIITDKDGFFTVTQTITREVVPPERERRVETVIYTYSKTARIIDLNGFPHDTKTETITIGNLEFVKEDNKNWQKFEKSNKKAANEESKKTEERNYVVNFLGRKKTDGKEFDLYEKLDPKDDSFPKIRYWIDASTGLPAKIETEGGFLPPTNDWKSKIEGTYEPDANLKIEAPELISK
jgi:hypothetical protein